MQKAVDQTTKLLREARDILIEASRRTSTEEAAELLQVGMKLLRRVGLLFEDRVTFLSFRYQRSLRYDRLNLQESHSPDVIPLRYEFLSIQNQISDLVIGDLVDGRVDTRKPAARAAFLQSKVMDCLTVYRRLLGKRESIKKKVAKFQQRQAEIIKEVRKVNGELIASRRQVLQAERDALVAGRFWECREVLLKDFFRVPYDKRKLVAVSEQYRAALFVEVDVNDSYGYKTYLCGIDDNGEEWGFRLGGHFSYDCGEYGIERAMARCWDTTVSVVQRSFRQGEILFFPTPIPRNVPLEAETEWQVAPNHTASSPDLWHNGEYMGSSAAITVSHPTHPPLTLPPGDYQVLIHEMGDPLD